MRSTLLVSRALAGFEGRIDVVLAMHPLILSCLDTNRLRDVMMSKAASILAMKRLLVAGADGKAWLGDTGLKLSNRVEVDAGRLQLAPVASAIPHELLSQHCLFPLTGYGHRALSPYCL